MRGAPSAFGLRILPLFIALVLTLSACSDSTDSDESLVDPPASAESSTATSATTAAPTPSTTEANTSDPDPEVAAIKAVWTEFIQVAASRSDTDRVAELSTGDVPALADEEFFDPRDAQSFYTQVTIDGENAAIEDCSLFSKPLSLFHYIPINGAAVLIDGQWQISDLEVNNTERCIPGDFAAEIYAVYEAYWDAQTVYRNPPDPDNPLILQLTTGSRTENQLDVLQQQIEANLGWQGRPETHPEFLDFTPGKVLVTDCQLVDPASGLYDLTTGERSDRFDEIVPEQRDSVRTRLEFADGSWKVAELGATRDAACEFAPTDAGDPRCRPIGDRMTTSKKLRRFCAIPVLAIFFVATGASPSGAEDDGEPVIDSQLPPIDDTDAPETEVDLGSDDTSGEVEVETTTPVGGSPGSPGEPDWQGLWERFCGYTANNASGGDYSYSDGARVQVIWVEQTNVEARLSNYRINCIRADGSAYDGGTFELPDGSGVDAVDPTILRARAFARIEINPPGIESNPSFTDRHAVVHIPTWLWVTDSWDDRVATDSDGGLTVQVIARATGVLWEFNEPVNENWVNCEDEPIAWTPGAAESDTNCNYTFVKSSAGAGSNDAFEGTATISWEFSWTLNSVDQGVFANIDGVTPFEIQVGEIQAVGTPDA